MASFQEEIKENRVYPDICVFVIFFFLDVGKLTVAMPYVLNNYRK